MRFPEPVPLATVGSGWRGTSVAGVIGPRVGFGAGFLEPVVVVGFGVGRAVGCGSGRSLSVGLAMGVGVGRSRWVGRSDGLGVDRVGWLGRTVGVERLGWVGRTVGRVGWLGRTVGRVG